MKKIFSTFLGGLALCAGASLMVSSADASIIISSDGGPTLITTGPNAGDFNWSYFVTLSTDQNFRTTATPLTSGDFTSIIDFGGLVVANFQDAADDPGFVYFAFATSTGPGIPPPGGTDSAAIANVVLRNTGATILGSTVTGAVGDIGTLTITSTSGATNPNGQFSSEAQKSIDGSTDFNQGLPLAIAGSATPEPMTSSLMGAGLLVIGLFGRRRFQKK